MSEHQDQCAVIEWAGWHEHRWPELRWLYAIPNGGGRSAAEAGRLKAEGVKAGVSDLHLPFARASYIGLFVEMKVEPKRPSRLQTEFQDAMRQAGHRCVVAYGPDEAIAALENYLALSPRMRWGGIS